MAPVPFKGKRKAADYHGASGPGSAGRMPQSMRGSVERNTAFDGTVLGTMPQSVPGAPMKNTAVPAPPNVDRNRVIASDGGLANSQMPRGKRQTSR